MYRAGDVRIEKVATRSAATRAGEMLVPAGAESEHQAADHWEWIN
jgi:hypothetical protein